MPPADLSFLWVAPGVVSPACRGVEGVEAREDKEDAEEEEAVGVAVFDFLVCFEGLDRVSEGKRGGT